MDNLQYIAIAAIFSLVLRVLWALIVPAIILLISRHTWRNATRWISLTLMVVAAIRFVGGIPMILMHPLLRNAAVGLSMQEYSRIVVPMTILNWVGTIGFLVAVFGMSLELKRRAEPTTQPYGGSAGAPPPPVS